MDISATHAGLTQNILTQATSSPVQYAQQNLDTIWIIFGLSAMLVIFIGLATGSPLKTIYKGTGLMLENLKKETKKPKD